MTKQEWFSVVEFATLVGWSKRYVISMIQARLVKAKRREHDVRAMFLIPRSELIRWGLIENDENELT